MHPALLLLAAVLSGLILGVGDPTGDPSRAEAVTGLRAKVTWRPTDPTRLPSSISSRQASDPSSTNVSPYAVFRDATITRQTNPFADKTVSGPPPQGLVVESGDCFPIGQSQLPGPIVRDAAGGIVFTPPPGCSDDMVDLIPSLDVRSAVISVQQEFYDRKSAVHVMLMRDDTGEIGTELNMDGTADAPALIGNEPFTLHVVSHIPLESQLPGRRPTRRVFTSTVRVGERTTRATSVRGMVRPLIVRTEMYLNRWAEKNLRPTPTMVGATR